MIQKIQLFADQNPVQVTQIALGCDHFGTNIPKQTAMEILDAYYEAGGNFLDTAHVYSQVALDGPSRSEQIVGQWIASNKLQGKVVISDKGAHPDRAAMHISRIDEANVKQDIVSSMEALQTDSLDIWFLHRDNPQMPVDEIMDIVYPYVEKGHIRHLGASNWTVERIAQANAYAAKKGRPGFVISQIQWSLAHSTPADWADPTIVCMDDAQAAWYEDCKFPVMAYAPQGRGIFSKIIAYGITSLPDKTRERFATERNLKRVEKCRALCVDTGANPAGVCLAYLTSAPFPTVPVIGCSSAAQIRDSLQDAQLRLTQEQRVQLIS